MRSAQCRTWNMARKLKNMENETQILFELEYGMQNAKTWKMRNRHFRTWSTVRKLKIMEKKKKKKTRL